MGGCSPDVSGKKKQHYVRKHVNRSFGNFCNKMSCFQFAVFLLVILIVEIAIGIVAFVNRDGWDQAIRDGLSKTFDQYGNGTVAEDINNLQRTVSYCCIQNKSGPIVIEQWFPNFFGPPPSWFHKLIPSAPYPTL
jgi:hypothetical protein